MQYIYNEFMRGHLIPKTITNLSAVDIAKGVGWRLEGDNTVGVLEDAVLREDVWANQLDVLRDVGLRRAYPCQSNLTYILHLNTEFDRIPKIE